MSMKKREPGLDLLRCLALILVISVHFFMKSGFYSEPVLGWRMIVMLFMRTFCMTCVPIFMMLSGYLLSGETVSARYYKRIVRIYITYLLIQPLCFLYRHLVIGESFGLTGTICLILKYEQNYSWYINMYIGLFLLAPFLNGMYHSLQKQSHKKLLVWSLLFMTAFPALLNTHQVTHLSWWLNPTSSDSYHQLIPDWWLKMYPITYYILGCYFREYPIKWKMSTKVTALVLGILVIGLYNLYRTYSVPCPSGEWSDHKSILTVILTVLLFTLCRDLKLEKLGDKAHWLIQKVSRLSLAAYLLSWIPDQYFYPILIQHQPSVPMRLNYFPIMVVIVLTCSVLMAAVVDFLCSIICRGLFAAADRITAKANVKG